MVANESVISCESFDSYLTKKFLPYVRSLYDKTVKMLSNIEDFFNLLVQAITQQQTKKHEVTCCDYLIEGFSVDMSLFCSLKLADIFPWLFFFSFSQLDKWMRNSVKGKKDSSNYIAFIVPQALRDQHIRPSSTKWQECPWFGKPYQRRHIRWSIIIFTES